MCYCSYTYFFLTDLPISNNPNGENHEKSCLKTGRNQVKKERVYTELYMIISTPENVSDPSQVFLIETYVKLLEKLVLFEGT